MADEAPESSAEVRIDKNGVIHLDWTAGGRITGRSARIAQAEVNRISSDRPRPMLVNMALTDSVDREARTVFTEPSAASRIALLGRSPVDRVIANFVLGVSSMPTPTRFFTSEKDALRWLAGGSRA